MRKLVLSLAATALALLLSLSFSGGMPKDSEALTAKPNIVFILADDMRKDDLKYMPKTQSLLQEKGMTFQNAFVSNPICCPSRATTMTGQYSHNSGVWTNGDLGMGGLYVYRRNGYEQDNVATRLDAAGYRTALFGKYLNGYKGTLPDGARYVPPGWDRWFATVDPTTYNFYNYDISDNGTITHFGTSQSDYKTDVLKRKTKTFISNSASLGTPFFAYVAPIAPHGPATPAPRDEHTYDGVSGPRLPSFNERDVSDKPPWIRQLPRLSDSMKADIDKSHEKRAESLQAVDDLVGEVVVKLRDEGVLSNTYVFFTSDNGVHLGEHRIPSAKYRPYEEDIHVPLLVRGPGVMAGSTTYKLTLNTDYLPTFISLAGGQTPSYPIDGRSLKPVLHGSATPWRNAILIEGPQRESRPPYRGIRTVGTYKQKYVEYEGTTAREMYYLGVDPYELRNEPQTPPAGLVSRLQALKNCSGATCRTAEEGQ